MVCDIKRLVWFKSWCSMPLGVLIVSGLLSGCVGSTIWSGASIIYDRHNTYKKIDDFKLGADANRALYQDTTLKCKTCIIDVAVFNRDLLLAGHVPARALRREAQARVASVPGYRRIFNQLSISYASDTAIRDSWITAKIRSEIVADSEIDPNQFKVVTADQVVYLMGDVVPEQASRVVLIARKTSGVKRVVKLFKYYHLSDRAA